MMVAMPAKPMAITNVSLKMTKSIFWLVVPPPAQPCQRVPWLKKQGYHLSLLLAQWLLLSRSKFVSKRHRPHGRRKVFDDMKNAATKVGTTFRNQRLWWLWAKQTGVAAKYGITLVVMGHGPKDTGAWATITKIKNTDGVQAVFVFGLAKGQLLLPENYKRNSALLCRSISHLAPLMTI